MIRKSTNYWMLATLLTLLAACRGTMREELQSVSLVVTNGTLVDGTGADPITDGLVAIHGNRIVAVGPAAGYQIPEGAAVLDAGGGPILPGSSMRMHIELLLQGHAGRCSSLTE